MRKGGKGKTNQTNLKFPLGTSAPHCGLFQVGHPANPRTAHVPALAAAHEPEEGGSRVGAGALVLLPRHRGRYDLTPPHARSLHLPLHCLWSDLKGFCLRQLKPLWSLPSCPSLLSVGRCPSCHKSESGRGIVCLYQLLSCFLSN